jgi:hypothetical protein
VTKSPLKDISKKQFEPKKYVISIGGYFQGVRVFFARQVLAMRANGMEGGARPPGFSC